MILITKWQAFILGVLQGLTEFFPVSSFGHLVVAQHILGIKEPLLVFDIILHLGTLAAIIVYFFNDLKMTLLDSFRILFRPRLPTFQERRAQAKTEFPYLHVGFHILIAMIPITVAALLFYRPFESLFFNPKLVGICWTLMGILLIVSQRLPHGQKTLEQINWKEALLIGLAQCAAITPGISRSGATILAAMALGFSRQNAAIFSFILLIPATIGAVLFEMKNTMNMLNLQPHAIWIGFLTSAIVGYFAIYILMQMVRYGRFYVFGYYCLLIGLSTSVIFFSGGL